MLRGSRYSENRSARKTASSPGSAWRGNKAGPVRTFSSGVPNSRRASFWPSTNRLRSIRAKVLNRLTFSLRNERHFERRPPRSPIECCKCFLRCSLATDARCVPAGRALAFVRQAISSTTPNRSYNVPVVAWA
jgi:hypothetical protein